MFKFWRRKKNSKAANEESVDPKDIVTVDPKDIVTEIVVVNNRTEKEYTYSSINEFGINWDTVDGWLHIWQQMSHDRYSGIAIAALIDFSIIKVVREHK